MSEYQGVTQLVIYPEGYEPTPAPNGPTAPTTQHHSGQGADAERVIRIDGNGTTTSDGVTQWSAAEFAQTHAGMSILATARNSSGYASGHIDKNTTVEIQPGNPATRTSIGAALFHGVLR